MKKIIPISRFLKITMISIAIMLPFVEAGYWITNGYPFLPSIFSVTPLPLFGKQIVWNNLSYGQKFVGFLVNMLNISLSMSALFYLSKLFKSFEKLAFFEKNNVDILRKAAWILIFQQIGYPIYTAILSITLTFNNPVGERNLTIGWGSKQFELLAVGLALWVISWIFDKAKKLQEEQNMTV